VKPTAIQHPLTLDSKPTGEHFTFLRSARGSGAGSFHFQWRLAPGKKGPGRHVHETEMETFSIVSGTLRIWIDDKPHDLTAGSTIAVAANVPHRFLNPGTEPVVVDVMLDGPKMEDQFIPIAVAAQRGMSMPRVLAKMMVHIVAAQASTPTSAFERAMFRGLSGMLWLFGVRGFQRVDHWEPAETARRAS
jgi:mannose-6-phosphate isomerase-like protein (cupin superfamily)